MKQRRTYEDDDGYTVADMSGVSRPSAFLPRREKPREPEMPRERKEKGSFLFEEREGEEPFTPEERRIYVFAALKASLLIAAALIVGLGAAIVVMILAWSS